VTELEERLRAGMLEVLVSTEELYPGIMDEARDRLGMLPRAGENPTPLADMERMALIAAAFAAIDRKPRPELVSAVRKISGVDKRMWVETVK